MSPFGFAGTFCTPNSFPGLRTPLPKRDSEPDGNGWQRRTKDVTPTLDSFIDTIPAADDADPDEASQEA